MWIFLATVSNAAIFGYLIFGLVAVGYVVQVSLVVSVVWVAYRIFVEYWDELSYELGRGKALREWAKNKRRLS